MIFLDYYLTSLEPSLTQTIFSQSIGGYCSETILYYKANLSQNVGLYDTVLYIDSLSGGYSLWSNISYIMINNELLKISSIDQNTGKVEISQRAVNNILEMHISGDCVRAVSGEIFNDVFNVLNEQYRCVVVKNNATITDPSNILSIDNILVYLKQNSRNLGANIEIAIEIPNSQYVNSISTSRTSLTLTDASLIGVYEDNYFAECFLKPEGEIGGIIRSFDSSTGTFVFYSSFSVVTSNKTYEIFPSPSQRIKSGIEQPQITSNMSLFKLATKENPIVLNNIKNDSGGFILSPNDVFYVWLKRKIIKGSAEFLADDFVINISYNVTS